MKLKERNDPGKYLYMKAAIKATAEKSFNKYRLRHLSLNFLSFFSLQLFKLHSTSKDHIVKSYLNMFSLILLKHSWLKGTKSGLFICFSHILSTSSPLVTGGAAVLSLPAELGRAFVAPALVGRDLRGGWGMTLACQVLKYFILNFTDWNYLIWIHDIFWHFKQFVR